MIELRVPGDKSITHRALMLAALADGRSVLAGALVSADTQATANALRAMGAAIPEAVSGRELVIEGRGLRGLQRPADTLECANSGTTVRLLMGLVAGLPLVATFDGDASLRQRPMRRVTEPLELMGASVTELETAGRLPIRIEGGRLRPLQYSSELSSAQVKSALLLAALTGQVELQLIEPLLSRDHSERMLRAAGAVVEESITEMGHEVRLQPPASLRPLSGRIPGDFSSAAFFLAAALLGITGPLRLKGVGVNPTRTGLLDLLYAMGAAIRLQKRRDEGGEPTADLVVEPSTLNAVTVTADLVPRAIDELPVLAMLAARANGTTRITGAAELRVKESDRIRMMVENLGAVGVDAEELPDGMVIHGRQGPLKGNVRTAADHRIAMAFGILAQQPGNQITLDNPDVVSVSFPHFWRVLMTMKR